MAKHQITIEIDEDALAGYSDEHLALYWHVGQANPADIDDKHAGELAERIGREIIRRWLRTAPVQLWHHQGRHYYWDRLRKLGRWVDGDAVPNGTAALTGPVGGEEGEAALINDGPPRQYRDPAYGWKLDERA